MKKTIAIAALAAGLAVSALNAQEQRKTLVVYFSVPETQTAANMTRHEDNSVVVINGKVLGNTEYAAQIIQQHTGADIFRIEPETPYPVNHETLINLARDEQRKNARPALKTNVPDLAAYTTVFVGYPNWWGDMPQILYTFFDTHDFAGKTIIPFNTHGGSGFSNTINTIARLEPDATVNRNGFSVHRDRVENCEKDIASWLAKLGFKK